MCIRDSAETENNRIIDALLVELDGFKPNDGVIVVGATNHAENVDPALTRDGRFDRCVYLSLPNLDERTVQLVARMAVGLSPASIAGVVNAAAVLAVQDGAT